MADAQGLGPCGETHGGSNPLPPILLRQDTFALGFVEILKRVEKVLRSAYHIFRIEREADLLCPLFEYTYRERRGSGSVGRA